MIATEAAAEGVNLQFCSLVVNPDLPWNPQRIEQNEADLRVFQLLSEKFRLFDGVFGASDEVLGALESGVDFEKRVAAIYQNCRTAAEIDAAFNELQKELEDQITARLADTRAALLEHFDEDVTARLRLSQEQAAAQMDRLERCLWHLTRHELREAASFQEDALSFTLERPPVDAPTVPAGAYQFVTRAGTHPAAHPYRPGHPLAELLVARAANRPLAPRAVVFDYGAYPGKISLIERLRGQSGWLALVRLTVEALEREDHLLFAAITDGGEPIDQETCEKLMLIPGQAGEPVRESAAVREKLEALLASSRAGVLTGINERNSRFFDEEIEKLDRWADDLKYGLEQELKELDVLIKQARKEAKLAADLEAKVALHRQIKELEAERSSKRRMLFDAQDEIDARKESLIAEVEARLRQRVEARELFVVRWKVV